MRKVLPTLGTTGIQFDEEKHSASETQQRRVRRKKHGILIWLSGLAQLGDDCRRQVNRLKSVALSILRIIAILLLFLGLAGLAYLVYSPGEVITDDRRDLETNGIWLQHNWVGNDQWFEDTPVLLRLPFYHDAGTGYHRPEVETSSPR